MPDGVLQKLTQCAALLARCRTAQQAKRIADISEAARVYAKRVRASRDVVNEAAGASGPGEAVVAHAE